MVPHLPFFMEGEVVTGFGRGSKELGIPTETDFLCNRIGLGMNLDKTKVMFNEHVISGPMTAQGGALEVVPNFPLDVVQTLPKDFKAGVYYGLAQIDSSPVYRMVANIGWCPFYDNKDMSVETHVMHKFSEDFYGTHMKIVIIGYLREELNFTSVENLVEAIHNDIRNAHKELESEYSKIFISHDFFKKSINA